MKSSRLGWCFEERRDKGERHMVKIAGLCRTPIEDGAGHYRQCTFVILESLASLSLASLSHLSALAYT